ncbi:MAG TPA: hypothetical protein PLQ89_19055 [Phycisphaerae bacterium]|mgnify:FL=1|nr:hypothetical protein [Phycisphaerae bacterium]
MPDPLVIVGQGDYERRLEESDVSGNVGDHPDVARMIRTGLRPGEVPVEPSEYRVSMFGGAVVVTVTCDDIDAARSEAIDLVEYTLRRIGAETDIDHTDVVSVEVL